MPRTPKPVKARKKQVRAATAVMRRALRAEGDVTLDRAIRGYAAALCQWRKAILSAAGVSDAGRAVRRTPVRRAA